MKILKSKNNPLIIPGLSIKQRLAHFSAIFTYFESYQKLIYLVVPIIYLFTGIMPIQSQSGSDFLIHWLPCFILLMITNQALGRGYYRFLEVEEYNILKMFTFIKASFSLFSSKRMTFKVTPKSVESSIKSKEKHEVYLHSIILVIILLSIIFGIVNLSRGMFLNYSSTIATVIAILLSLLNSYLFCGV